MISRYLQWFRQHRLINALLVFAYIAFLIFAHEWFVNLSVEVMRSLSLHVYNKLVAGITTIAAVAVIVLIARAISRKVELQRSGLLVLALTLAALIIHFFVFTEMNVEFIHAVEYGILATLIYPLVGRFAAAVVYSFPVMLFDEWYQYQVLFDWVEYFDFNDILLDLLGAGLFLAVIKTFSQESEQPTALAKRPEVYVLLLMAITAMMMLLSSAVVPYTEDAASNTWLVLNAIEEPYGFWRVHPLIGSTYHVLEPITGLITVFSVCLFYLAMDTRSSEK